MAEVSTQSAEKAVLYEFEMLIYTYDWLGKNPIKSKETDDMRRNEWNCHVEAFALHARQLLGFFFAHAAFPKNKGKRDQAVNILKRVLKVRKPAFEALDSHLNGKVPNYAANKSSCDIGAFWFFWSNFTQWKPKFEDSLSTIKDWTDKRIVHLTSKRGEAPSWGDLKSMFGRLEVLIRDFLDNAELMTDGPKRVRQMLDSATSSNSASSSRANTEAIFIDQASDASFTANSVDKRDTNPLNTQSSPHIAIGGNQLTSETLS